MTKLFLDGGSFKDIKKLKVDGYTYNPSIFRKLGAKLLKFLKKILKNTKKTCFLRSYCR